MTQQSTTDSVDKQEHDREAIIRVSAGSPPEKVASAIAHTLYDGKRATCRAIGAGAVNQAVKACAIARGYVATRGMDLTVRPGFATVDGDNGSASAIVLIVIGN